MKKLSLNGYWDFGFTDEKEVYSDRFQVEYHTSLPVPGCFDVEPGYKLRRGVGVYRRTVNIGGTVSLVIDGLGPRGRVWWDDRLIGECVLPFSREVFEFDAGGEKEHLLYIEIDNRADDSPSSLFPGFYDFYRFGGVYGDVSIASKPEWDISYLKVLPRNLDQGTAEITVDLSGSFPETVTGEFTFNRSFSIQQEIKEGKAVFTVAIPDCPLWNPENPQLIQLDVRVGEVNRSTEFGMRTIEVAEGQLLFNGKPFKLIGYNRHNSHPDYGYAMPEELVKRDLELIKRQGCNFVRGSHYPQSEYVLKWCDKLGLLLWEESIGWGNKPEHLQDETFRTRQHEQTRRMVRRSINHPSLILHGFMNELASDRPEAKKLIEELAQIVREEDDSRLVTFASNLPMTDICLEAVDVISFNIYPGWYINPEMSDVQQFDHEGFEAALAAYEKVISTPDRIDKPYIISEIGAAALPGCHGDIRWTEEYQAELAEAVFRHVLNTPRCSGLSLWLFCDTRSFNDYRIPSRPRGFNNKGVLDEYRRPKTAWNRISKILKTQFKDKEK